MTHRTTIEKSTACRPEKPLTAASYKAATISFIATLAFLILLTGLHFIKPEIDPSWRFISEYAIGLNGWIMVLAFMTLAVSYLALYFAIRSQIPPTIFGRIVLALLLISALALVIAGLFVTDPITSSENEQSLSGQLHNLGGTLGMAMPIAALCTCIVLRKNKNWITAKRPILLATIAELLGFLVSIISLGFLLSQSEGRFGPDVLVGWPTRFELIANCVWLLVLAWQTKRLSKQNI